MAIKIYAGRTWNLKACFWPLSALSLRRPHSTGWFLLSVLFFLLSSIGLTAKASNNFFCQAFLTYPQAAKLVTTRKNTFAVDLKGHAVWEMHIGFEQAKEPLFYYDPLRLRGVDTASISTLLPRFVDDLLQALQDDANILPFQTPQETFYIVTNGPHNLKDNMLVLAADRRTIVNIFARPFNDNPSIFQVVNFKGHRRLKHFIPADALPQSIFNPHQIMAAQTLHNKTPSKGFLHRPGEDFSLLASFDEVHAQWRLLNPIQGVTVAFIHDYHPARLLRQAIATYFAAPYPPSSLVEFWQTRSNDRRSKTMVFQLLADEEIFLGLVIPPTKTNPETSVDYFANIVDFPLDQTNAIFTLENFIIEKVLPNASSLYERYKEQGKMVVITANPAPLDLAKALKDATAAKSTDTPADPLKNASNGLKEKDNDLVGFPLTQEDDDDFIGPDEE